MSRLPMWKGDDEEVLTAWDQRAKKAASDVPLKGLSSMPRMVGISEETAKNLKWKSFKWMLTEDHQGEVRKGFLHHPFKYAWRYIRSLFQPKSFKRKGDFFLYGLKSTEDFETLLDDPDTLLVLGFSYCHKPFECPSGRFTPECQADEDNPVCQQCFIGKAVHLTKPNDVEILYIPTVHYIGGKIFEFVHANPKKKVIFLITACEMTLEMFGDWGNMVGIRGIGVRLDGRICNTMQAFALSEKGIKPGLTVVLDDTQKQMIRWIQRRNARET